jgi:hypothetical protein
MLISIYFICNGLWANSHIRDNIAMRKLTAIAFCVLMPIVGCESKDNATIINGGTGIPNAGKDTSETESTFTLPDSDPDAVEYESIYDEAADNGQYYMPLSNRVPKKYWTCVNATSDELNQEGPGAGLQYSLLCESLAGLVNGAMEEGKTDVGIWLDVEGNSYELSKAYIGDEIGRQTGIELLTKDYGPVDGIPVDIKDLIDGYVLTDVTNNPESGVVASVASHVYNSIIVDVRDKEYFDGLGYEMKYDASGKTTEDAWAEFKDKCSNEALVVMPVQTAELREFVIKNKLFCININKSYGSADYGQNLKLFKEVLSWLKPNAPVLGWEQGVSEDSFVNPASVAGHPLLASDWSYNHTLTSVDCKNRQSNLLAKVKNPRDIDYGQDNCYVSFFLSDGDNYQWVMGDGFTNDNYCQESRTASKMSFSLCVEALSELAPSQLENLFNLQGAANTVFESFGGGYFYVDTYSTEGNRTENLAVLAQRAASHMRQHRIKILEVIAEDVFSEKAQEAYKAFIEANDQLEGIIAIQYSPYNGGKGKIFWETNTAGYDIPIVTTKYSLWKGGTDGQGDPTTIASELKSANDSLALVCVHAWSDFDGLRACSAALSCLNQAGSSFKAANVQELIWRIRMRYRKDQTLKYLKTIK